MHRTAISTTIKQRGGPSFSEDPLLGFISKGIANRQVTSKPIMPAWDLFLVLSSLREAPYEPLSSTSLKFLTQKTVFLVSLASGRRCSEVHAFCGKNIGREPDGSLSLSFLAGFLAKNQPAGMQAPPVVIKGLTHRVCSDDPDRTLCPVRALSRYRRRTNASRSSLQRRLFLPYKDNKNDDVSKATVSRWIRDVIARAYNSSSDVADPKSFRAHEVRAWASSLAFSHNTSLEDVMKAAFWRNNGTFMEYYLRDVSRLNEDGSRGISSVVAAQQTLSVATQRL